MILIRIFYNHTFKKFFYKKNITDIIFTITKEKIVFNIRIDFKVSNNLSNRNEIIKYDNNLNQEKVF